MEGESDFNFTVMLKRIHSYNDSWTGASVYASGPSQSPYLFIEWKDENGNGQTWGSTPSYTRAKGWSVSGGGSGDQHAYYVAYFSYKYTAGWPRRFAYVRVDYLQYMTEYGYAYCGITSSTDNSSGATTSIGGTDYYLYQDTYSTSQPSNSSCKDYVRGTYYFVFRKKYTLTYNANGGSGAPSSKTMLAAVITSVSSAVPTRTGYTFTSWNTEADGTGTNVSSGQTMRPSSDSTLYAQWTPKVYTIALNKTVGSGGTSTVYLKYNTGWYSNSAATTAISSVTIPTRSYYDFLGYFTSTSGGTQIINSSGNFLGNTTFTTSNTSIYARWEATTYTLTIISYYSQGVTDSTNLQVTAQGCTVSNANISPNEKALVSHTYDTSSYNITISASNANASSKISYYLGNDYSLTETSYSGIDSFNYTWTPYSNDTIYVYVKQRYTIDFNGNGYTGGTVPSQMYKIWGTDLTIPSNNLTRTGYTAHGWNASTTLTDMPIYTTYYSANANGTLYANWKANSYTVSFDVNGGSSVSDKTMTYNSAYGELPTPTRSGCTFGGWYTNENFTTKVTSSTVVKTAANHTLYAKWIDNGANDLKYDSTEKYFYFEDGKYPQTYVGDDLNSELNGASVTQTGTLEYFNGTGNIEIPIYSYSGSEYAKLTASNTMTLELSGGSFTFTSGQDYWFKVEPIRWRVSEYGVSSTSYPSGLTEYGSSISDITVVSDKILTIGAVTNSDTKEGWSFTQSELFNIINESSTTLTEYHKTNESIDYDEYASASGNIKVTSSSATYTGIRVASEADVKTNFTDMSAKASDMVMFLLGTSGEYVDYWTRDLVTLNNGKVITKVGESVSRWLDNISGVRFAMTMSEGVRVSQS